MRKKLVEPAIHVPVDVAEVIADRILAVVGKLDRRPAPLALALALHLADEDFLAHELELFELVEKLGVEQGGLRQLGHGSPPESESGNARVIDRT